MKTFKVILKDFAENALKTCFVYQTHQLYLLLKFLLSLEVLFHWWSHFLLISRYYKWCGSIKIRILAPKKRHWCSHLNHWVDILSLTICYLHYGFWFKVGAGISFLIDSSSQPPTTHTVEIAPRYNSKMIWSTLILY